MNIKNVPSPNFINGRKIYRPEAIVIHIMEGSLSGTDSWFQSRQSQVSAHYGVGKTGEVHQYVQERDTAWHAGRVNAPTWNLIKPSGSGQFINPNYYTIGIEHEGSVDSEWTDEMYNTSATMIKEIAERWNISIDRNHVIGHHEIYSVKTCPGHRVDINKLIALATNNALPVPLATEFQKVLQQGKITTIAQLNIRTSPDTTKAPFAKAPAGVQLAYDGFTNGGESINGNAKWFFTHEGNWFWSGGTK